jgi:hypothetical protein
MIVTKAGTIVLTLTEDEAKKLAGLLQAVDTDNSFFVDLACEIDAQFPDFMPVYAQDDAGTFVEQQEEV